ncbi:MAG TPA: pectate lyase, partial [Candidatus Saccharimonadia bacterium]|nr:pectate lyase [Candidatus Saccharimonadia bacterium]
HDVLAGECRQLGLPASKAAPGKGAEFEMESKVPPAWYGSAEALKIADAVLSYQTPTGGWSKAIDYTAGPRTAGTQWTSNADNPWHYCGTLDNRSTTEQITFLAQVHAASQREDAKAGALRGIEWLLAAQFPNGGWPQVYPVEPGYHEAITLNDGAMLHALEVMLAASQAEAPFAFVDEGTRKRAAVAFEKGMACLLASQVQVAGKATVWCAQHDPISLAPVAARLKEPPSLSGAESAEILRFMMRKVPSTPEITSTIQSGIAWLNEHRIQGLRKAKTEAGKTDYVQDPASTEIYWARFYDVETGQPIFAGAQDGKIYATFHEMAEHNKVAYDYFTKKPGEVVGKEFERWKKRVK